MQPQDMSVLYWQPQLIALTWPGHPDIDLGAGTRAYVNPQEIVSISMTFTKFSVLDKPGEHYPAFSCTVVTLRGGGFVHCTEPPQTVALLRDRAMGHQQKPEAVEP